MITLIDSDGNPFDYCYTKVEVVAMLTELQLEIEEQKQVTKHLHYDDLENAESYNTGIDNCIDSIQIRIDKLREGKL